MDEVAYVSAVVLAGVFGWAGAVKLTRRPATVRTFRAFGVAAPEAMAVGVPTLELVLAAAFVVVPGWAAVAAIAVLAGFTTVLVRAMRAGVDVGCGCFGTARREPVSAVELVRNGFLATAATVATFADRPVRPGIDAVILVTTAAATAAVVLALCELRRQAGAAFRLDLGTGP